MDNFGHSGTQGDKAFDALKAANVIDFLTKQINTHSALTAENVMTLYHTGENFRKLYETDAELKELLDTAKFEQQKLARQAQKKLVELYKKKRRELCLEMAEV